MSSSTPVLTVSAAVGVVGAGRMGAGIASVAAAAGHQVLLYDAFDGAAQRGRAGIQADLQALVARGKLTAEAAAERVGRIVAVGDLADMAPAALVIEAVVEDPAVKVELFQQLEAITGADTILATNTSSLSVAALAGKLKRPAQFAGFHFFNPAPVMPLVEVIAAPSTAETVVEALLALAGAWGKSPVRCAATPGFIVNRVARPYYGEAMRLLSEGAADVATIDAVLRDLGGFRMGPFELTDMIGHDVNYAVTCSVYDAFYQDPRYKPSMIQRALVEAGRLGKKTGQGFYNYAEDAAPALPQDAAPAPPPARITVLGDLGPAAALADLARAQGIEVTVADGCGVIECGPVRLALTDGHTASARQAADGQPTVLFDASFDYAAAARIAIAAPDGLDPAALAAAVGFFQALGKTVSVIDDAPGMVVLRTVAMLANEAADAVLHQVACAADVETAMMKGAGYRFGPLEMANRLGADRLTAALDALAAAYPEGRYRASPLLRRIAVSGWDAVMANR